MPVARERPVRVAVVNDYELVVVGVAALLEPYSDRVAVVELDSGLPVAQDVDVILYDTFGQVQGPELDLDALLNGNQAKVVIYSWNVQPDLVDHSMAKGASGYLTKGMDAEALVSAIEDVHDGKLVLPAGATGRDKIAGDWPGKDLGLSAREAEIIALITQGLSNQDIAQRSYLSINSVKTYIRTAYRKMGVTSRSQAVLWGVRHGFQPDLVRAVAHPEAHRRD
jgi:NarL family two-component system response regulator LiaR